MLVAVAAAAISCQTVKENSDESSLNGGYKFDFSIAAGGFSDTKADATVGWTNGEKVFVFFKPEGGSLIGDAYAEFEYNDGAWTPNSYLAPGALGTSGKMAAVYVPYLGSKTPVFSGDSWTIDGGDVYYSCASGAAYTVEDGVVIGRLSMRIPDGYVQYAVNTSIAADGDVLACNIVDAYECVTLSSDLVFSATPVAGKKMTGHEDNGKVYFWGMLNGTTAANCEFTLTTADGDVNNSVPADKVGKNNAYNIMTVPEHSGVQLWKDGPFWATTNIGAERIEDYGDYFAWGDVETYYEAGYAQDAAGHLKSGKGDGYAWTDYKWCGGTNLTLTKYNVKASFGNVDNITTLEESDDVAHAILGGIWRLPTAAEFETLVDPTKCKAEVTTYEGVAGMKFTGLEEGYTENWIFLPFSGLFKVNEKNTAGLKSTGYYWSSSLVTATPSMAYYLGFNKIDAPQVGPNHRAAGYTIRAVN